MLYINISFFLQQSPSLCISTHCKKKLAIFPSPAWDVTITKLSLVGNNLIIPGQGEFLQVTSRLGPGKPLTFFTVHTSHSPSTSHLTSLSLSPSQISKRITYLCRNWQLTLLQKAETEIQRRKDEKDDKGGQISQGKKLLRK